MPRIHPTAIVDPSAALADDVEIGPFCIVESDVRIGAGTVLRAHATVRRYTTLGEGNFVDSCAVLGGEPQDLKFSPATKSFLRIGDRNVFREAVTISRATGEGNTTVVGNNTYWMACSHAGHNAIIADEVILVNGAAVGGYGEVGRGAILSAYALVHQFAWVGSRTLVRGNAAVSAHAPPYVLVGEVSRVLGLNVVGLRRAPEITDEDHAQIREAFNLTFRRGLTLRHALQHMDEHDEWGLPARVFREFVRRVVTAVEPYKRGLASLRKRTQGTLRTARGSR